MPLSNNDKANYSWLKNLGLGILSVHSVCSFSYEPRIEFSEQQTGGKRLGFCVRSYFSQHLTELYILGKLGLDLSWWRAYLVCTEFRTRCGGHHLQFWPLEVEEQFRVVLGGNTVTSKAAGFCETLVLKEIKQLLVGTQATDVTFYFSLLFLELHRPNAWFLKSAKQYWQDKEQVSKKKFCVVCLTLTVTASKCHKQSPQAWWWCPSYGDEKSGMRNRSLWAREQPERPRPNNVDSEN